MTAEEFIDKDLIDGVEASGYFHGESWDYFEDKMILFAQYHVQEALKQASEKSKIDYCCCDYLDGFVFIDKESILNSYDLNNIK